MLITNTPCSSSSACIQHLQPCFSSWNPALCFHEPVHSWLFSFLPNHSIRILYRGSSSRPPCNFFWGSAGLHPRSPSVTFLWGSLICKHEFNYHLYIDDIRSYLSTPDLFPSVQGNLSLSDIFLEMSIYKHKINMVKKNLNLSAQAFPHSSFLSHHGHHHPPAFHSDL